MWTHRAPYVPSELTEESIERHGRMALYRALHYDRLVAFVGSGVSAAYGGPAWSDLAVFMADQTQCAFDRVVRERSNPPLASDAVVTREQMQKLLPAELRRLHEQLKTILAVKGSRIELTPAVAADLSDQMTTILALCEEALRRAASFLQDTRPLARTRQGLADQIDNRTPSYARAQIEKIIPLDPTAVAPQAAVSHEGVFEDLWMNRVDGESLKNHMEPIDLLRLYAASLDWGDQPARSVCLDDVDKAKTQANWPNLGAAEGADVIDGLRKLGARRFATLNFDTVLERRFNAYGPPSAERAGHTAAAISAARRRTDLPPPGPGDLFNFAVLDSPSDDHVVHVHGRVDDPAGMVLTEEDYRRLYVAAEGAADPLNEAMRVLFAGNDILFVGVGLKEDDVLGPLRAQLMRDRSPDADARQAIALMPAGAAAFSHDAKKSFRDRCEADLKAQTDAERKDALFTIHQKLKYGINVLRFGRNDTVFLNSLRLINTLIDINKNNTKSLKIKKIIESKYNWLINHAESNYNNKSHSFLFSLNNFLEETLIINDIIKSIASSDVTDHQYFAMREMLKILKGRVLARGLVHELDRIRRRKDDWWDDWRRLPRERRAHFHVFARAPYPVWVRHCPQHVTALADFADKGPITAARSFAPLQTPLTKPSRHRARTRVLRLAVPRGGGKGAFLRTLFDPAAHKELFGHAAYDGAFFAHMSFSIEFSSVIGALSRFVAGRLAAKVTVAGTSTQDLIVEWQRDPQLALEKPPPASGLRLNRLEVLRGLLKRYSEATKGSDRRLLIGLGGLERLCDANGDAHNPMHRGFFRLLIGGGETRPGGGPGDPPLDVVLVASRVDVPIAYLSLEESPDKVRPAERNRFASQSATGRHLRKWDQLPRLSWAARLQLTPQWHENRRTDDRQAALIEILPEPDPYGPTGPFTAGRRQFWNSIALSVWGLANFSEYANGKTGVPLTEASKEWLLRMSRAAARGQFGGTLDEILAVYDEIDDADLAGRALRQTLLEHFALFVLPIEPLVLYLCPEVRARLFGDRVARFEALKEALETLVRRGLVMEALPGGHAGDVCAMGLSPDRPGERGMLMRYVIHDQLREHIAERMNLFVPDGGDRNHFEVSLYSEQPRDMPTPSFERFGQVRAIVRLQIGKSRETLEAFYVLQRFSTADRIEDRHIVQIEAALERIKAVCFDDNNGLFDHCGWLHAVPQRLRACYALLRGAFSISALSRLSGEEVKADDERPFDAYRDWLRGLVNAGVGLYETRDLLSEALEGKLGQPDGALAKLNAAVSPLGSHAKTVQSIIADITTNSKAQTSSLRRLAQPFYIDEIAWLLNERGLASLVQGRIYDAVAHFDRAIAVVVRDPKGADEPLFHATERRIRLNRAIALIEHGEIADARGALSEIVTGLAPFLGGTPSSTHLHARGYLALCDHLTGNLERARTAYVDVIAHCNTAGNLRAAAVYDVHMADLMSRLGDGAAARRHVDLALAAAAQSEQRDVLHHVIVKHAQLLLAEGDPRGAIERTAQAESYGAALGLHRIRAEALLVRGEALLAQGDARVAGGLAAEAVAICHRHGMRLRRVRATILYGEVLLARNQRERAIAVLKNAQIDAERMRYQAKAARAHRLLSRSEFAAPTPVTPDISNAKARRW